MTDQITIANMALGCIGARSTISSLTEGSPESNAIALYYDPTRRSMLRSVHWNFARRQANLTLLGQQSVSGNGIIDGGCLPPWQYEYAYPSDCVKARYVMPPYSMSPAGVPPIALGQPIRFEEAVDLDAGGNDVKVLLTNYPQAQLVYTRNITNTEIFDDNFVTAFANLLGFRICPSVNGDKAMAKAAFELAQQTALEARVTDGNEGTQTQQHTPDWMRARGYASDYSDANFFDDPGYYGGGFGASFVD